MYIAISPNENPSFKVITLRKHAYNNYTVTFSAVKIWNFQLKILIYFLIFAQTIDCGYTVEPPRRGSSNEYPQSKFLSKNKKNRYNYVNPIFTI